MVHSVNEYIPGARSGCGCAHNGTRLRASTPEMTEVNSTSNERLLKPEGPDRRIIDPYKHTLGLDDSGRISMSGPKTAAFHKHNAGTSFGGGPTEAKISFRSLPTSRVETRLTRTLLTRIQDQAKYQAKCDAATHPDQARGNASKRLARKTTKQKSPQQV